MVLDDVRKEITEKAITLQDENGCWNVLKEGDKYYNYPELNYYVPNYTSTLWTLIMLADIKAGPDNSNDKPKFGKPLEIMAEHFYDSNAGIYAIGKSHFPIPCLNGNMLYLHHYFGVYDNKRINGIIDFFHQYQRFDDGGFKTPSSFPYYSNKSCYGKHTCYWGITKLLKGLSFIPRKSRTKKAEELIAGCIDFILLHNVCFSSRDGDSLLHRGIAGLTFPNMYHSDFLEILWLLRREGVEDRRMEKARELLRKKMKPGGTWELENQIKKLTVAITKTRGGNGFITERAREVLA